MLLDFRFQQPFNRLGRAVAVSVSQPSQFDFPSRIRSSRKIHGYHRGKKNQTTITVRFMPQNTRTRKITSKDNVLSGPIQLRKNGWKWKL